VYAFEALLIVCGCIGCTFFFLFTNSLC